MMWQVGLLATATAAPSCETPPPRYAISDATNIELALKTHGYVILTGHDGLPAENITLGLPAQVFGGRLLSDGANTLHAVHDENAKMQAQFLERQAACKESGNCYRRSLQLVLQLCCECQSFAAAHGWLRLRRPHARYDLPPFCSRWRCAAARTLS